MEDLAINCKNLRIWREKDSTEMVVEGKVVRGGMTTTRSGSWVEGPLRSCLGDTKGSGINNKDCGSRNCEKGVQMI